MSAVEDLADHHDVADDASGVGDVRPAVGHRRARSLHEPITWDGERLPLRRAPLWMEHTYDVLVDELGLDPARFAELIESKVLW